MSLEQTNSRTDEQVRIASVGILSGAIAGLIGGIGARIDMRIVALLAHQTPVLTGATMTIILMGAMIGVCPGVLYMVIRKYLPGPGLVKGAIFGFMFSLIIGLPIFVAPAALESAFLTNPALLVQSLFAVLPLIYGIVLETVQQPLKRFVPVMGDSEKSVFLYMLVAILAIAGIVVFAGALLQLLIALFSTLFHA